MAPMRPDLGEKSALSFRRKKLADIGGRSYFSDVLSGTWGTIPGLDQRGAGPERLFHLLAQSRVVLLGSRVPGRGTLCQPNMKSWTKGRSCGRHAAVWLSGCATRRGTR